jgi:hypothetical protein
LNCGIVTKNDLEWMLKELTGDFVRTPKQIELWECLVLKKNSAAYN